MNLSTNLNGIQNVPVFHSDTSIQEYFFTNILILIWLNMLVLLTCKFIYSPYWGVEKCGNTAVMLLLESLALGVISLPIPLLNMSPKLSWFQSSPSDHQRGRNRSSDFDRRRDLDRYSPSRRREEHTSRRDRPSRFSRRDSGKRCTLLRGLVYHVYRWRTFMLAGHVVRTNVLQCL